MLRVLLGSVLARSCPCTFGHKEGTIVAGKCQVKEPCTSGAYKSDLNMPVETQPAIVSADLVVLQIEFSSDTYKRSVSQVQPKLQYTCRIRLHSRPCLIAYLGTISIIPIKRSYLSIGSGFESIVLQICP
jgi:hypothetical protein